MNIPANTAKTISPNIPSLSKDEHAEILVVTSKEKLITWNRHDSEPRRTIYNFTVFHRWCFVGYYYAAPSSYYPYGPNDYSPPHTSPPLSVTKIS